MLAALISGVYENGTTTFPFPTSRPTDLGAAIINVTTSQPARSRQDIVRITADPAVLGFLGSTEEKKEAVARALGEVCQTRVWNLMIDVVAQSGHYPPNAATLAQFVVESEKRYWLHLAMDRLSGEVIDRQLEAVYNRRTGSLGKTSLIARHSQNLDQLPQHADISGDPIPRPNVSRSPAGESYRPPRRG